MSQPDGSEPASTKMLDDLKTVDPIWVSHGLKHRRSQLLHRYYSLEGVPVVSLETLVDLEQLERTAVRAASGDRAALDALLTDSRPLVFARCNQFLPNELDAEEATQDALLAVAQNIQTFEQRSKFTTWLYRITSNAAIDCYRKLKRRRSVLELPPEQLASGSTPSVVVGAKVDLFEAANKLDWRVVEPVLLRDFFELDYAEIGLLLDIPVGTIKSRIHEGRSKLRHVLYGQD